MSKGKNNNSKEENNKEQKIQEKRNQIIYIVLVILFIIALVFISLIYNNKIDIRGKKNKEIETEITNEELFKQIEEAQRKRQEEAEVYLKNVGTELEVTIDTFIEKVLKADKPVLIDYYAAWCGPCHQMSPIISELAKEQDDFYVYKINIDLEPELATIDDIISIPTFVVYKDGKRVNYQIGVLNKEQLINLVKEDIE